MKNLKYAIALIAITITITIVVGFIVFKQSPDLKPSLTTRGEIPNFALLDHNGKFQELYGHSDADAIVIISQGNDCPIIQKFTNTIASLEKKFLKKNVRFFFINSNLHDDRDSIIKETALYGLKIPVLLDPSQVVAETLGITRTAEALIIDPNGWKLLYRGAISDQFDYGVDKQVARNNYLEKALGVIINKESHEINSAPAKGCLITFAKPDLSYAKSVGPIIVKKCLNCHSESGKFSPHFNDYNKFKSWSAMSLETILNDRMPPSSLDTYYGNFSHKLALSNEEKSAIVKWIRSGMPNDGKSDPILKFNLKTKNAKNLRKNPFEKIYEASMKEEHKIPPGGETEYHYKQLGGALPYDLWINSAHVTPTNPRLIHHMSVMAVQYPLEYYIGINGKLSPEEELARRQNKDGSVPLYLRTAITKFEMKNGQEIPRFQIWAAGKPQPFFMPKGTHQFFPKGSYLVMEAHYMGSGKPETDITKIEFFGTKEKQKGSKPIYATSLAVGKMLIPAGAKDHIVSTPKWTPKKNIHLHSFMGHLHMRGRSVEVKSTDKKGRSRTFLSIPNYYYGWQTGTSIHAKEPIAVKGGEETFQIFCHYDNSAQNPYNPDPSKDIKFGQRHDTSEMCLFHIVYTVDEQ